MLCQGLPREHRETELAFELGRSVDDFLELLKTFQLRLQLGLLVLHADDLAAQVVVYFEQLLVL